MEMCFSQFYTDFNSLCLIRNLLYSNRIDLLYASINILIFHFSLNTQELVALADMFGIDLPVADLKFLDKEVFLIFKKLLLVMSVMLVV